MADRLDKFKGKIMYQIFVDRFYRGGEPLKPYRNRNIHKSILEDPVIGPDDQGIWCNDYYGGDLKGIEMKLPYIKSLGVSIIYLTPIVESQSNHRYDAGDYEKIDYYVGNENDLKSLCNKAHEMGISIILDGVFNHTGNDSKYFNEFGNYPNLGAFQSKDSEYFEFYLKNYDDYGNYSFNYWWDQKNMPKCDGNNPKWINYITGKDGIIDKWYHCGIDGLRLDVADDLTDHFIKEIKKACFRNKKEFLLLGEVWKNVVRQGRDYLGEDSMDSVMNYPLADAIMRYFKYTDAHKLSYTIDDIMREYPDSTIKTAMNFVSTHDITRGITTFGDYENLTYYKDYVWDLVDEKNHDLIRNFKLTKEAYNKAKELLKVCNFTLCFMPGILSIFSGDEVGVEGLGNLIVRRPYPWGRGDKELLSFYRSIGKIRAKEKFLEDASYKTLELNNNIFMFERENEGEKMLTVVNRTADNIDFKYPEEYHHSDKVYTLKKAHKGYLEGYSGISIKK